MSLIFLVKITVDNHYWIVSPNILLLLFWFCPWLKSSERVFRTFFCLEYEFWKVFSEILLGGQFSHQNLDRGTTIYIHAQNPIVFGASECVIRVLIISLQVDFVRWWFSSFINIYSNYLATNMRLFTKSNLYIGKKWRFFLH
jgi:hypothetical protein